MNVDPRDPIFHDEDAAREHFESLRWPDGKPFCPHCGVDFGRMLAKIAHAYVAAEMRAANLAGFDMLLPQFIRCGAPRFPSAIVGGSIHPVEDTNHMYQLRVWSGVTTKYEYLVVTVRLFAAMRAPAYDVVVGRRFLTGMPLAPTAVPLGAP